MQATCRNLKPLLISECTFNDNIIVMAENKKLLTWNNFLRKLRIRKKNGNKARTISKKKKIVVQFFAYSLYNIPRQKKIDFIIQIQSVPELFTF